MNCEKNITLPQHCIAQNVIVIVIRGHFKKTTFNKEWAVEPENPFRSYDVAKIRILIQDIYWKAYYKR